MVKLAVWQAHCKASGMNMERLQGWPDEHGKVGTMNMVKLAVWQAHCNLSWMNMERLPGWLDKHVKVSRLAGTL